MNPKEKKLGKRKEKRIICAMLYALLRCLSLSFFVSQYLGPTLQAYWSPFDSSLQVSILVENVYEKQAYGTPRTPCLDHENHWL